MEAKKSIKSTFAGFVLLILLACPSCQYGSDAEFSGGEGTGGSLARFTITNNNLFTVDPSALKVFDLTNPEKPVFKTNVRVGFGVETIFPFDNNLFLGTASGMYIYDIRDPVRPVKLSFYEHIDACDPVVTDGRYAYVTLSSSNQRCWRAANELQIVDIRDPQLPVLVKQYPMSNPQGMALRNDTLWVCDEGLKVFDVRNKNDIRLLHHFPGISAYDVIWKEDLVMVTGKTGFIQYRLENNQIKKLSYLYVQN